MPGGGMARVPGGLQPGRAHQRQAFHRRPGLPSIRSQDLRGNLLQLGLQICIRNRPVEASKGDRGPIGSGVSEDLVKPGDDPAGGFFEAPSGSCGPGHASPEEDRVRRLQGAQLEALRLSHRVDKV